MPGELISGANPGADSGAEPGAEQMDERKAEILRILVSEHIRTGEPVSSRAILEAGGLSVSAATVRNELAVLEAEGYAVQPHTSAGRVPTSRAYRCYVDALGRPAPAPDDVSDTRVAEFFSSVHSELGRLLKATTSLLSEITRFPALVTDPGLGVEVVKAVHLVQTSARAVLLVVVTRSGRVTQTILDLAVSADPREVEEAERIVRHRLVDCPVGVVRPEADPGPAPEASSESLLLEAGEGENQAVAELTRAVSEALVRVAEEDRRLYVGPASYLTDAWGDISKVRGVLEVLEREAALLEALSVMPDGTSVRIGGELGLEGPADISLVSTSYGAEEGDGGGRVGVIGPMRMDYGRTISAVEQVGENLDESLSGSG